MSSDPAHPLTYAPPEPVARRRRRVRRILALVALVVVVVTIIANWDQLSLRARRRYWMYRIMHHTIPPGTLLIERDPTRAAQLLASNPDYVADGTQVNTFPFVAMRQNQARQPLGAEAVYWPADFREYAQLGTVSNPLLASDFLAIAYMGERVSPGGHRRIVIVPFGTVNHLAASQELAFTMICQPPTFWGGLPDHPMNYSGVYQFGGRFVESQLQPGVADPKDRSHISLPFTTVDEKPGISGTYDLYLQDDDSILVKINPSPTTQP